MSNWKTFRWTKGRREAWNQWTDMLETNRIYYSKFTGDNGGVYELYAFCADDMNPDEVRELVDRSRPVFAPPCAFIGYEELLRQELTAFIDTTTYIGNCPNKKMIFY